MAMIAFRLHSRSPIFYGHIKNISNRMQMSVACSLRYAIVGDQDFSVSTLLVLTYAIVRLLGSTLRLTIYVQIKVGLSKNFS